MFGLVPGETELSNLALEQLLETQVALFDGLGLSYRVLDMPAYELGHPAYRKFDIEAVLPGRSTLTAKEVQNAHKTPETQLPSECYGEISSCSNCTDYQARRLNIKDLQSGQFCHTVNGTACAIPRMIMAISEQYQTRSGTILIPDKLRKYMRNAIFIQAREKATSLTHRYITSPKKIVDKLKEQDRKCNMNKSGGTE